MSLEENKAIIRRLYEALNKQNQCLICERAKKGKLRIGLSQSPLSNSK